MKYFLQLTKREINSNEKASYLYTKSTFVNCFYQQKNISNASRVCFSATRVNSNSTNHNRQLNETISYSSYIHRLNLS